MGSKVFKITKRQECEIMTMQGTRKNKYQFECQIFFYCDNLKEAKEYLNYMQKNNKQFWVRPSLKKTKL